MTRRVEEDDRTTLRRDLVGTDMLGDSSSLATSDVRFSDLIEERGFTMVNMTHDRDHRRAEYRVWIFFNSLFAAHWTREELLFIKRYVLRLKVKLWSDQLDRSEI